MGLLLRERIVFLGGEVSDFSADAVVAQLLMLDAAGDTKGRDIQLFINSPGGSVTAGMGIYDAMRMCRSDVGTCSLGMAASMGAFLLAAGTRGKRRSLPNARIMVHQPLGGASGAAVDIEIQAREIMYHKANLNRILASCTGKPIDVIEADTDRDRYMSPVEARVDASKSVRLSVRLSVLLSIHPYVDTTATWGIVHRWIELSVRKESLQPRPQPQRAPSPLPGQGLRSHRRDRGR